MKGSDVRIILAGPARAGKTMLANAADSLISDFISVARQKPSLNDPYRLYASLRLKSQRLFPSLSGPLEYLPTNFRAYRDTKALRELSKIVNTQPIVLGSPNPETGAELKTFAITNIGNKHNLFVFDMRGKDFETFFRSFLAQKSSIFLGSERDELVSLLSEGFLEFLDSYAPNSELSYRISRVRKAKDLKSFFSRARKAVRDTYLGRSSLAPEDVTLIVLFSALAGLYNESVKTAILLVYGPESADDASVINEIKTFRDIALNTRRLISGSPGLVGITHSKIDVIFAEFVKRSGADPLDPETRRRFVSSYLASRLRGPYEVKSVHAAVHDPRTAELLGSPAVPEIPYNVLAPIYALFERAVRGSTAFPSDLYMRTLPYPYAHIYFALEGGI